MPEKQPKSERPPTRHFFRFFGLGDDGKQANSVANNGPAKNPEDRKHQFAIWYFFAAFLGLMLIQYLWLQYSQVESVPYSQFEQLLDENKISEVVVGPNTIQGTLKAPFPDGRKLFTTTRVDPELAAKLSAHGIKVSGASSNEFLSTILSWLCQSFSFI